jgi:glycosyltransferase involved in cell wall biosynthesis
MEKLSVVTSAYNESAGIVEFLNALLKIGIPGAKLEFVIVNNGSLDNTGELIEKTVRSSAGRGKDVKVVHNKAPTQGYRNGLLTGLSKATGKYVAIIRSDFQEDPEDIGKLYALLKERGLDGIVGWRKERHDPIKRRFLSNAFNLLCRLIYQLPVPDINGAPKIFMSSLVKGGSFKSRSSIIDMELLWRIKRRGGKLGYAPAAHFERKKGKVSVTNLEIVWIIVDFVKFTVQNRFSKEF